MSNEALPLSQAGSLIGSHETRTQQRSIVRKVAEAVGIVSKKPDVKRARDIDHIRDILNTPKMSHPSIVSKESGVDVTDLIAFIEKKRMLTDAQFAAIAPHVKDGHSWNSERGLVVDHHAPQKNLNAVPEHSRKPPSDLKSVGTGERPPVGTPTPSQHEARELYNVCKGISPQEPISLRALRQMLLQVIDFGTNDAYRADRLGKLIQILLDNNVILPTPDPEFRGATLYAPKKAGLEWLKRFAA